MQRGNARENELLQAPAQLRALPKRHSGLMVVQYVPAMSVRGELQ